jgi:hypothetical protein
LGKIENCMVTVHLGFALGDFFYLLDGEWFLPRAGSVTATGAVKRASPTIWSTGVTAVEKT